MQHILDKLATHEQREIVLTLAQPSMVKFLDAILTDAKQMRHQMTLPQVSQAANCQQYVADMGRLRMREEVAGELVTLLQMNLHKFMQES
jgi:hypothetical protein